MIKIINLLLLVFFCYNPVILANSFSLKATETCQAYLSKNKHSNPDQLLLEPGVLYPILEANQPASDWLRVTIPSHHTQRWVDSHCGIVQEDVNGRPCRDTGGADSHVLALSSQAGFCETYGFEAGKPECSHLSKDTYQANHLTLHGLWPNRNVCGQEYGYCGVSPRPNHCDYDPIAFSPEVGQQLKQLMPSFHYGSCLERHEWNKHGTCQILSPDDYFSLAMRLLTEMDSSVFGDYLTTHRGEQVSLSALRDKLNQAVGVSNRSKVYLGCKNGILVDVYIQLPALIVFDEPLFPLIDKAPEPYYHDSCPDKVKISAFSTSRL